ncbi:helix-turn-helix domain-containing protein [Rhizobium grahamii]|uniref:Transcriptional regulator n=1 Tax=Rhizobium grahamii TaxID=1120045 RepID=A0A370KFU0_9HYPH|nr:helix-turn-helix transcriptional regulator [Rhizobium grahamii]RDJ02013.1 transcriptional regulator [Rhizobium grahamii]
MRDSLTRYAEAKGLVETTDPEVDKRVYRKPGFDGAIMELGEMEALISGFLKRSREGIGLPRADVARMLGLSTAVYGRYERAFSKMNVTRMIHLCEVLGFKPLDIIFHAAPHLWGATPEEAADRIAVDRLTRELPGEVVGDLLRLLRRLVPQDHQTALASIGTDGTDA